MFRKITLFYIVLIFIPFIISCQKNSFPNGTLVDLTYDFSSETIYWPTAEGFELKTVFKGPTEKGYFYFSNNYMASEHGGTHIDAPNHFAAKRKTVDQIPLEQLIGEAVVIDVSGKALNDRDYQVSVDDFKSWEGKHGKIEEGSIVLLNTGYGKYWPDKEKYMGTSDKGADAVMKLHFPGLHPDAAKWLMEKRSIKAIGLDTPSIDYGQSQYFKSHQILFKNNIPAFENVANLDKLPPRGAVIIALPMKIKGGSGAPLRIVAIIPNHK
ncbi:MAG: cyclase family protein [Thermodesulfobacteriota bacterium]